MLIDLLSISGTELTLVSGVITFTTPTAFSAPVSFNSEIIFASGAADIIQSGQILHNEIVLSGQVLQNQTIESGQILLAQIAAISGVSDITYLQAQVMAVSGQVVASGQTTNLHTQQIALLQTATRTLSGNLILSGQIFANTIFQSGQILLTKIITANTAIAALSGNLSLLTTAVSSLSGQVTTHNTLDNAATAALSGNLIQSGQILQAQINATVSSAQIAALSGSLIQSGQILNARDNTLQSEIDLVSGSLVSSVASINNAVTANATATSVLSGNLIQSGQILLNVIFQSGQILQAVDTLHAIAVDTLSGSISQIPILTTAVDTLSGIVIQNQVLDTAAIAALSGSLIQSGQVLLAVISTVDISQIIAVSGRVDLTEAALSVLSGNLIQSGQVLLTRDNINDTAVSTLSGIVIANQLLNTTAVSTLSGIVLFNQQLDVVVISTLSGNVIQSGQVLTARDNLLQSEIDLVSGSLVSSVASINNAVAANTTAITTLSGYVPATFKTSFQVSDWVINGIDYTMDVSHNLGTSFLDISILNYSNNKLTELEKSVVDQNKVRLVVAADIDGRFSGQILIVGK